MAVKRTIFEAVGGFDEQLVTGEDAELCDRIRGSGHRIYESASLRLIHLRNMSTLKGFFDKQVWHSLGMLGGQNGFTLDKMTGMTMLHAALSIAAVGVLFGLETSFTARLGIAALLMLFVPTIAVIYRVLFRQGAFIPLRSVVLYSVYFLARSWGLVLISSRRSLKG